MEKLDVTILRRIFDFAYGQKKSGKDAKHCRNFYEALAESPSWTRAHLDILNEISEEWRKDKSAKTRQRLISNSQQARRRINQTLEGAYGKDTVYIKNIRNRDWQLVIKDDFLQGLQRKSLNGVDIFLADWHADKTGKRMSVNTTSDEKNRAVAHLQTVSKHEDALGIEPNDLLVGHKLTGKAKSKRKSDLRAIDRQLRKKLQSQAILALAKQLHQIEFSDCQDYQILAMEIGLAPTEKEQTILSSQSNIKSPRPEDHNRFWQAFDAKELINPQAVYILSSDTGTGKTTFLRNLQLEILKEKEFIPVFLHADKLAGLELDDSDRTDATYKFISRLVDVIELKQPKKHVTRFLKNVFKNKSIVLLVDGLDQIQDANTNYRTLLDGLVSVFTDNLIIASRPFAVISQEETSSVKFLRLRPFYTKAQKQYFGKHYNRACEVCYSCRKLMGIPMLAYLVRLLIENGQDRDIKNRSDIYKRFVDYILKPETGYKHDKLHSNIDIETDVRQALCEISYEAIARKEPYLQKIPSSFCRKYAKNQGTTIVRLLKHGLVKLVADRSQGIDKFVYFSHQSFQEYLAAEWAFQDEVCIERILREAWNPKWKEIIKFLAGLIGEPFVHRIYSPQRRDDCIHSRFFLAAECCGETCEICDIEEEILRILKTLITTPPFEMDVLWALSNLRSIEATDFLLELVFAKQDVLEGRESPFKPIVQNWISTIRRVLGKMENRLSDKHRQAILAFITDYDHNPCEELQKVLCFVSRGMTDNDIVRLIEYQCQSGVITAPSSLFVNMCERLSGSHIDTIFRYIRSSNSRLRNNALNLLCYLTSAGSEETIECAEPADYEESSATCDASSRFIRDKIIPEHIEILTRILRRKTRPSCNDSHKLSFFVLGNIAIDKMVPANTIDAIIALLTVEDGDVCELVSQEIENFCASIGPEHLKRIGILLDDQNPEVQLNALHALAAISKNLRSREIIEEVVHFLDSDIPFLRTAALTVLQEIPERLNESHRARIVRLLPKSEDIFEVFVRKLSEFEERIAPRKITHCESGYLAFLYCLEPVDALKAVCRALRAMRERISPAMVRSIIDAVNVNSDTFVRMATEDEEYDDVGINVDLVPLPSSLRTSELKRILTLLNNRYESIRQAALIFLSSIAKNLDQTWIHHITSSLNSDCPKTIELALNVLAKCGELSSAEINAIIPYIGHEHLNVREMALYCLYVYGRTSRFSTENVSALISLLERNNPTNQFKIGSLLTWESHTMPPGALDRILALFGRRGIYRTAAGIVEHYASQLSDEQVRSIEVLAGGSDASVRMSAIRLLVRCKGYVSSRRIDDVIECLALKPGCGAYDAIARLTHLLGEGHVDRIVQLYLENLLDSSLAESVTLLPRTQLARHCDKIMDSLDPYRGRLDSSHFKVLTAMAEELTPQYVAKMVDLLHMDDIDVRNMTYTLLKTLRDSGNVFFAT